MRECQSLRVLGLGGTKVSDLTPILNLPVTDLCLQESAVRDLSVLAKCTTLEMLLLPSGAAGIEVLRTLPKLRRISFDYLASTGEPAETAAEFWKEFDAKNGSGGK